MTLTEPIKHQQSLRLGELAEIARQRYLESGGEPHRAANGNEWLTDAEKAEYLRLARQVFDDDDITQLLGKSFTASTI